MQDQIRDPELAGLARPRPATTRPAASTDQTILAPIPAPLDCPYLLFDDDGPGCLALAPAIRLSRRQVELVCAGAAHVACPRLIRADSGRAPAPTERPPAIAHRRDPRTTADDRGSLDLRLADGPAAGLAAMEQGHVIDVAPKVSTVIAGAADAAAIETTAAGIDAAGDAVDTGAPTIDVSADDAWAEPEAASALDMTPEPGTETDAPATTAAAMPPAPAAGPNPVDPVAADLAAAVGPAAGEPVATRPRREVVIAPPGPPRGSTRATGEDATGRRATGAARLSAGTGLATAWASVRRAARTHIVLRPATAAAWLILLGTLVVIIALLASRGGLSLPPAGTGSPGIGAASPSSVAASPTVVAGSPSPAPSASAGATPSAQPPSPSPSVVPTASPPFPPDRLAVLTACPGVPDCYQYRIKANDNLRTLAKFFGVAYPAMLAANPQITNPSIIHVGDRVTIPVPSPQP